MPPENSLALHVLEAELADVQATKTRVLLWIGGVVPGVQLIATKQNGLDHVAAFRDLTLDTKLFLKEGRQEGERCRVQWSFRQGRHRTLWKIA